MIDETAYKYIDGHSTLPCGESLDWLVKQTNLRTNHARMLSGSVQGQLMAMLVRMTGTRRVLELGTFTGYSSICLASALPADGHLDTLELNDELEDLILEGFARAGVADRITLHMGDCKQTLEEKIRPAVLSGAAEPYDLVYIDANKREYCSYYRLVYDIVRKGGLILADNVLWDGKVWQSPLPQDAQTLEIARFNKMVHNDPRAEVVILPLRDGLSLIRKK